MRIFTDSRAPKCRSGLPNSDPQTPSSEVISERKRPAARGRRNRKRVRHLHGRSHRRDHAGPRQIEHLTLRICHHYRITAGGAVAIRLIARSAQRQDDQSVATTGKWQVTTPDKIDWQPQSAAAGRSNGGAGGRSIETRIFYDAPEDAGRLSHPGALAFASGTSHGAFRDAFLATAN